MDKSTPVYGYMWKRNRYSKMSLVYTEDEKDEIQALMLSRGNADEYRWFELKEINYDG